MSVRWLALAIALLGTVPAGSPAIAAPTTAPATQPATRPAAPTETQIKQAIRQLNHPSPSKRRAAIRQLAEWGPVVFPQLRRVAQSGDMEAALSARDLLRELEVAILLGARVSLEVDRPRIAWNEPFALTVKASNPTSEKIEAPWPAAPDSPATQPAEADVRQVAAMMDAGDFLTITDPDGHELDLRVDPIERDQRIYDAVNLRARDEPPSHSMPAGTSDRLVVPLFNRGWARYPMLAAGRYTITFSYQPQWNDASWTKDGFGLVRSEPVSIEITESAPEAIRKATMPLRLEVKRDGQSLIADLVSEWDCEFWVNLNFGGDARAHAEIDWRLNAHLGGEGGEVLRWEPAPSDEKFSADRVHILKPGERIAIGRAPVAAMRDLLKKVEHPPEHIEVTVRYTSLSTPAQIRDEAAEKGQAVDVPRQLYSGTIMSEPLSLDPH